MIVDVKGKRKQCSVAIAVYALWKGAISYYWLCNSWRVAQSRQFFSIILLEVLFHWLLFVFPFSHHSCYSPRYVISLSTLSKRVNVTIKCYALHIIGVNDKERSRTILDVARYFFSDFSMNYLFGHVNYSVYIIIIAIETRGNMSSPLDHYLKFPPSILTLFNSLQFVNWRRPCPGLLSQGWKMGV